MSTATDDAAYTCPGLSMSQPPGAPFEGYVACYRAGHECPPAVPIVKTDDTHRTTTLRCPCCGDFHGSMFTPLEWETPAATLVDIHLNDGTAVRAEQVAPGLAIQPALAGDNEYTGRWHLVHVPSNCLLNGRSVADLAALRAAAATIVAAGHDWNVPERDVPDEAIRVAHDAIQDLYAAVGLL